MTGALQVYLDLETTSGDSKLDSLNPWHHCSIAGFCITVDDNPNAWYIPVGHNDKHWNLDQHVVITWLTEILVGCKMWINHNIKYDAHVLTNWGGFIPAQLVDTLTLAKIIDSDRYTYGLKQLVKDWLGIEQYDERVHAFLKGANSKDYGDVPADILGEYGCADALYVRELYRYIKAKMPVQCERVCATEIQLTSVLVDIERAGMHVDPQELQVTELQTLIEMSSLEQFLHEIAGQAICPTSNADCFDVLCNKFGLPILGRTEKNNPSFDKDALALYLTDPCVLDDSRLQSIVEMIIQYRKLSTFKGLFIEPYQKLHINGLLHPSYNQAIRTGRMSCSQPNMQQLSKRAKKLVHPAPGYVFISADYSQIEFRLIVHYIENTAAIAAYAKDPDTDFHTWVAEMCGISRQPAKSINFAIGFGGGRSLILHMLSTNVDLVSSLLEVANGNHIKFKQLCQEHAAKVYQQYHATLPELRSVSGAATRAVKTRGYIYNAYGRHRRLPPHMAHKAFNSVIQSSAADLMKECTVATSPRHDSFLRDHGVIQIASVHDETLFQAPIEVVNDPKISDHIRTVMESPTVDFRVPIRVSITTSATSWAACS